MVRYILLIHYCSFAISDKEIAVPWVRVLSIHEYFIISWNSQPKLSQIFIFISILQCGSRDTSRRHKIVFRLNRNYWNDFPVISSLFKVNNHFLVRADTSLWSNGTKRLVIYCLRHELTSSVYYDLLQKQLPVVSIIRDILTNHLPQYSSILSNTKIWLLIFIIVFMSHLHSLHLFHSHALKPNWMYRWIVEYSKWA